MAAETQLGKLSERGDPLLTFKWVVTSMPQIEGASLAPEFVESVEIPFNNVKVEPVFRGGGYTYFPGFHDVSAFGINFYGDVNGSAIAYLMAWKKCVKNFETGIYYLPKKYKRNWNVALLKPNGDVAINATLKGCWPADTGNISLEYNDGASRISFNQNFSIDDMEIKK